MARQERAILANMRAMEEEGRRMVLHGSGARSAYGGQMIGAGATPSMGLSQFRGGRKCFDEEESDSDDEDLEGGFFGAIALAMARAAAARAAQAVAATTKAARAAAAKVKTAVKAPSTKYKRLEPDSRALSIPTKPNPLQGFSQATPAQLAKVTAESAAKTLASRKALALAALKKGYSVASVALQVGVPAYMLYDYLSSQQDITNLDAGYYDDLVAEQPEEEVVVEEEVVQPPEDVFVPPQPPRGKPETPAQIAERLGLTIREVEYFLRTGNLPTRKRGKGVSRKGGMSLAQDPRLNPKAFKYPAEAVRAREEAEIRANITRGQPAPPKVYKMVRGIEPEKVSVKEQMYGDGSKTVTTTYPDGRVEEKYYPSPQTPSNRGPSIKRPTPISIAPHLTPIPIAPRPTLNRPVRMPTQRGGEARKPNARAQIVAQVMRERGVKLGEASRIVKEEGLF